MNKLIVFLLIAFLWYSLRSNTEYFKQETFKYMNDMYQLEKTQYNIGTIDVYFKGANYLNKVIVNNAISKKETFTFSGPTNTTITITDLIPNFKYPISVVSWGRDFTSSSDPTKSRYVGLFNQTACRLDYNTLGSGTLTLTNATTTNLGVASTSKLPSEETLVARIFLIYF